MMSLWRLLWAVMILAWFVCALFWFVGGGSASQLIVWGVALILADRLEDYTG